MKSLEDVFALPAASSIANALQHDMSGWFRDYLRNPCHALRNQQRLPFGAFARQLRAAVAGMRPHGSGGVASGAWCLPCGLTAAQAWQLVQLGLKQLRIDFAIVQFQHQSQDGFWGRTIGPVGASVEPVLWPKAQPLSRKQREQQQIRADAIASKANRDPLAGINRPRLQVRLDKAFRGGVHKLNFLIANLLDMRVTLPLNDKIDRAPLALAVQALTDAIGEARKLVTLLTELTPDQQAGEQQAAQRRNVKAAKKKSRRQRQINRKRARIELRKHIQRTHNAAMKTASVINLAEQRRKPAKVQLELQPVPTVSAVAAMPLAEKVWKVRSARWFVDFGDTKGARRRLSIFYRELAPEDRREAQKMFSLPTCELAQQLDEPRALAA